MPRRWWIILLLLPLILGCASCQWHEAKEVIAMADSIDQTQHVIYDDTAALGGVIRTLDNPLGKLLMSNTLGKAYYYMGRNLDDYYQRFSDAAECYIKADRLHINDPIYRGRVNSCMGYICGQNLSDSLALIFYERTSKFFEKSNNKWYYAQTLLDRSEYYTRLHSYVIADSLLQIAQTYQLDSAYQARYYETEGLYFYAQQQYDSALIYFKQGLTFWQTENDKCFSYMKIMQTYSTNNMLPSALPYAEKLVKYSHRPTYLINAYYCLIKHAGSIGDSKSLQLYSHKRADCSKELLNNATVYAEAIKIIETYAANPHQWKLVWIIIFSLIVLCIILVVIILVYKKYAAFRLQETRVTLQEANAQTNQLSAQLKNLETDFHNYRHYDKCIAKIATKYSTPPNRWNQYHLLKKDIAPYLHDWLNALDRLDLTNREKVFCVFIFIYPHLPMSKIAYYMNNTENAVRVLKTRIAQKMGISSAELLNFLKQMFYTN